MFSCIAQTTYIQAATMVRFPKFSLQILSVNFSPFLCSFFQKGYASNENFKLRQMCLTADLSSAGELSYRKYRVWEEFRACLPQKRKCTKASGSTDSENRQRILRTPQNCFPLTSIDLGNLLLMQVEFAGFFRFSKLSAVCTQLCS